MVRNERSYSCAMTIITTIIIILILLHKLTIKIITKGSKLEFKSPQ